MRNTLQLKIKDNTDSNHVIIDYTETDYRNFWESKCKLILHDQEMKISGKFLPPSSQWLIDIGCGFGRMLPSYYNENGRFVLVDYALNNLETAKKINGARQNIFYIVADVYHLPFKDNVYQSAVCVRLFHHLNNPVNFINEMNRILKTKAYILFSYINERSLLRIFRYGLRCFKHEHVQVSSAIYATHPAYFKALIRPAGIHVLHQKGAGFIHQVSHHWPAIEEMIEKHSRLLPAFSILDRLISTLLGFFRLALMEYLLLQKK